MPEAELEAAIRATDCRGRLTGVASPMRRLIVMTGLFAAATLIVGIIATAVVGIAGAVDNSDDQPPWFLRHALGAGPDSWAWWLTIGLPPATLYAIGRKTEPENLGGVCALASTVTLIAYASAFAL